jgi:MFS transporter, PPP family, 3-phenylpropionic acid transporter
VTGLAERRQSLRNAIIITAFATAVGLTVVGTQHQAVPVLVAFVATCCLWTPMAPLTDAYALRGVSHYGLNYGPLRLWGSAAFVVGALACGVLVDAIAPEHLIWVIALVAGASALASLGLRPIDGPKKADVIERGASALLRDPGFLAIILASALIQGSHAAYYIFASIVWKQAGFRGLTIAGLWSLGVLAEIVVFALSPRFTLSPALLVVIAAQRRCALVDHGAGASGGGACHCSTGARAELWTDPGRYHGPAGAHRAVPCHGEGQGYLTACSGIVASGASIVSGAVFARYGPGVYCLMVAMALSGAVVMWLARHRLADQPHSAASGG